MSGKISAITFNILIYNSCCLYFEYKVLCFSYANVSNFYNILYLVSLFFK